MTGHKTKKKYLPIAIFAVVFTFFWFFDLLLAFNINVTVDYFTFQDGEMLFYYSQNIGEFSEDDTITSVVELTDEHRSTAVKIPDTSRYLRLDFEEELEELSITGVTFSYGIIPIAHYTPSMIASTTFSNLTITDKVDHAQIIATDLDPSITFYIGVGRYIIVAIKLVLYCAFSYLATILLLRLKKPTSTQLFILLVAAIVILPGAIYAVLGIKPDESLENATIAPRPDFSLAEITDFPKEYEEYYNDHVPFREPLIRLDSYFSYYVLNKSPTDEVVVGSDGWLFLEESVQDYKNSNAYTEEQLLELAEKFETTSSYLAQQDIEFYIMLAPNKNTIYGEYMPDGYLVEDSVGKTQQLVDYITKNTSVNIIYEPDAFAEYKDDYQLYYKKDSHWNGLGGYIGFKSLAEAMGFSLPELEDAGYSVTGSGPADLLTTMGITNGNHEAAYTVDVLPNIETSLISDEDNDVKVNIKQYESSSGNDKRLLMFRDSFGTELVPYMSKLYSESVFVWENKFDMSYVWEYNPDVVVYSLVERATDYYFLVNDEF